MDKQTDHKKQIALTTTGLLLLFMDAYMALLSNSGLYDFFGFIQNELARNTAVWIVQYLFMGFSAAAVYAAVAFVYTWTWRIKNKKIWYDGLWLHIHDKGNVRIGVVAIEQNFYDLQISGTNVSVNTEATEIKKTAWYYIGSMIEPSGAMQDELVGCYMANRTGEKNKYGVHIFDRVERSAGKPEHICGEFGDILRDVDNTSFEISDKMGRIHMYRMPKCIRDYIKCKGHDEKNFDYGRLSNILQLSEQTSDYDPKKIAEIRKTEFFKKLDSIMAGKIPVMK
mgnify:FL=1